MIYAWFAKFGLRALAILAVSAGIAYAIHIYKESLRQDGRDQVQALWDADKAKQQAAVIDDTAAKIKAMNAAAQTLIAATNKATAKAKVDRITEIFKDEKATDCKPGSDLIRVLNGQD